MHRWVPLCLLVVATIAPAAKCDDKFQSHVEERPSVTTPELPPGIIYDTNANVPWGNLQMRFVYDGIAPEPKKIALRGGAVIDIEQLVVNKKDSGIANIVVWLRRERKEMQQPLRVHPSYAESQAGDVPLALAGGAFVPHVTIVRTTQNLIISNKDLHGHSVVGAPFYNQPFNRLIQPGATTRLDFPLAEHIPSRLDDSIDPGVMGYLAVFDHPYAAVSDKSGKLKIEKLPTGQWTFVVWHETGYIKEATLGGQSVQWDRGRATLDIKSGDNDLGEVKVAPEQFKR